MMRRRGNRGKKNSEASRSRLRDDRRRISGEWNRLQCGQAGETRRFRVFAGFRSFAKGR